MAWIAALDRKLLRELASLKGQIATIALVLASGITCFIALRGTSLSLQASRDDYYDRARFAHVFARVERAPEPLGARLEALPGVAGLQTRIVEEVTVPMAGLQRAAYGQLLSLPAQGEPATNGLHLTSGRLPERGRDDEAAVLDTFARAHDLHPGDRLPVVINGKLRDLRVVGVAQSPEYVYAIRPGALAHDPRRYAVVWMRRPAVADAFDMGGAFNEVTLRLQPGASDAAVMASVDRLLAPYGCLGAIARKDQTSNRILTGELSQLAALAGMAPLVFLGVAAFLINMVLARLVALQRPEIAALKALGYRNGEIARHYLQLVGVVMVPGALLGVLGGWRLGHLVLGLYESIFRFPALFAGKVAAEEVHLARAALGQGGGPARDRHVDVRAPASGRVLRVLQKSEAVVGAGAPLIEVGEPARLEVVVDLLTTVAVQVQPGTPVAIHDWGGDRPLNGRVRLIEPSGFTKPSALGVDEQRVNVVVALTDPRDRWAALGDGYRVETRFVLWRGEDVVRAPQGALFRHGSGWAVYRIDGGRAALAPVEIGHRGETEVEVLGGLSPGVAVAVHPGDRVEPGARVEAR